MNNKTGIVMELKNKTACILTNDGEFVEIRIQGKSPSIGSTYSGPTSSKLPLYRYAAIAACLIFFISFGGAAYAYYTPVASIIVKINPSIELKINKWNRIIEALPLNDDGKDILNSVTIKNKAVDEGLNILLDEADKEHFINKTQDNQKISLDVTSDKNLNLNIDDFENKVKNSNLQLEVKYAKNNTTNGNKADIIKSKINKGKVKDKSKESKTTKDMKKSNINKKDVKSPIKYKEDNSSTNKEKIKEKTPNNGINKEKPKKNDKTNIKNTNSKSHSKKEKFTKQKSEKKSR
ncbi:anti-sigma factor domain-containing protein [Clostridium ganghwense]|uniref:Anti-sigma factor domain-containing protein n=1 Tax=Clostridium ganghwense TaxID=312089 RepID=A0ABT4CQ38_9CLOT|nr:anti-sigma factor domain-containing protein [Clostridium ganghwense]MCY6370201.1 anti-sigma factor domain-containing protein [Clostridium ganghwense]